MRSLFSLDGGAFDLWLSRADGGYRLHRDDSAAAPLISLRPAPGSEPHALRYTLSLDGNEIPVAVAQAGDDLFIHLGGRTYALRYVDPVERYAVGAEAGGDGDVRAPMPGTVLSVEVRPGQVVSAGDTLVIIESMKMETRCPAARSGTVQAVLVTPGQTFERDQVLVRLEAAA